ncbi:MAG: helix-hairpin-helix domain-containing protein [Terrimicrobiaceae bacterium]
MKKRVRESLLDEVPGISAARKRALLERFGSVERIKSLDPSRLAEVSGISQSLAERITATLNAN